MIKQKMKSRLGTYKIWSYIKVRLLFRHPFLTSPMGWTERISLILLGLSTLAAGLDKIIELCFADRIIDIILRSGKSFAAYKLGDQYQ